MPQNRAPALAMITYWTNFAKSGNPKGSGLPPWPAFDEQRAATMHFGEGGPFPGGISGLDKLEMLKGCFDWRCRAARDLEDAR